MYFDTRSHFTDSSGARAWVKAYENHPARRIFSRSLIASRNVAFIIGRVIGSRRTSRMERLRRWTRSHGCQMRSLILLLPAAHCLLRFVVIHADRRGNQRQNSRKSNDSQEQSNQYLRRDCEQGKARMAWHDITRPQRSHRRNAEVERARNSMKVDARR